jgi:hypothetical protein
MKTRISPVLVAAALAVSLILVGLSACGPSAIGPDSTVPSAPDTTPAAPDTTPAASPTQAVSPTDTIALDLSGPAVTTPNIGYRDGPTTVDWPLLTGWTIAPTDAWRLDTTIVIQGGNNERYIGLAACGDPAAQASIFEFGVGTGGNQSDHFVLFVPAGTLDPASHLPIPSNGIAPMTVVEWSIPGKIATEPAFYPTTGTFAISLTVRYDQTAKGYQVAYSIVQTDGAGATYSGSATFVTPPVLTPMSCVAAGNGRETNGFTVSAIAVHRVVPNAPSPSPTPTTPVASPAPLSVLDLSGSTINPADLNFRGGPNSASWSFYPGQFLDPIDAWRLDLTFALHGGGVAGFLAPRVGINDCLDGSEGFGIGGAGVYDDVSASTWFLSVPQGLADPNTRVPMTAKQYSLEQQVAAPTGTYAISLTVHYDQAAKGYQVAYSIVQTDGKQHLSGDLFFAGPPAASPLGCVWANGYDIIGTPMTIKSIAVHRLP